MNRLCVLLCLCSLLAASAVCPLVSDAAESKAKAWSAGISDAKAPAGTVAITAEKGERLGFFERRKLGLTIAKVRPVVEKLAAEGKIDRDNPSAAAAAVMHELMQQDPKAWGDVQLDFDAILEFLERLIPLIMKLIDLFSWAPAAHPSISLAVSIVAMPIPWRRAA